MKEETITDVLRNVLYKIVKPIYLFSVDEESIESYANNLTLENIIFHRPETVVTLEDYIERGGWFFAENPEKKKKIEKVIEAIRELD